MLHVVKACVRYCYIRNIFMKKKNAPKDSPSPFLILVNNSKQPLHPRNSFKNKVN